METKKRGRPRKGKIAEEEVVNTSSDVFQTKVVRQFPNPSWVGCDMDGVLIKVKISPRYTNKLTGKTINVALVSRDLIEDYEHIV